jgi:HSP20 family protein
VEVSVLRYDPFRELDRISEQLLSQRARGTPMSFPMDAYRRGDEFHVELDLPGVDPDSIDLTVEQSVLTIRAERRFQPQENDEIVVTERPQGTFSRQLLLSQTLDTENLRAEYVDGVLRLTIPVAERAKPRKIEIDRGSSGARPRTIEGSASS